MQAGQSPRRPDPRSPALGSEEHGEGRCPPSIATKITGHKTENVYCRYAVVSDADLKAAAACVAQVNGAANGDSPASRVRFGVRP